MTKKNGLLSVASACLLTSGFGLNAFAHPDAHHRTFKHNHSASPTSKTLTPKALTSRNIFFNGYCVDVSINITDSGAVYGNSNQCGVTNPPLSTTVVSGHISTINGVPNTIVISGHFGYLYGQDSTGRYRPVIIAIFPNNTFKAYSGSYSGALNGIDQIATGTWSSSRSRSRIALRPFESKTAKRVSSRATTLRNFQVGGYCKFAARMTDGIVVAIPSGFWRSYPCRNQHIIGGVVVSGVNGISDGTIGLNHIDPPGTQHPITGGENHFHYLFPGGVWTTYHNTATTFTLQGQGTYWEPVPPLP